MGTNLAEMPEPLEEGRPGNRGKFPFRYLKFRFDPEISGSKRKQSSLEISSDAETNWLGIVPRAHQIW